MTFDHLTNILVVVAALGLVVLSAWQLSAYRDQPWALRAGQFLVVFGVFALATNLLFGSNYRFAMTSVHVSEVCCLAGGILLAVAAWSGGLPAR